MAWTYLFVAGLLEVGWAIGLKYTDGFSRLIPSVLTVGAMVASVVLLGLALKTLQTIGIPRHDIRKDFDGDVTLHPGIAGTIDFAHPADAERRLDLVGTESCPGLESHGDGRL